MWISHWVVLISSKKTVHCNSVCHLGYSIVWCREHLAIHRKMDRAKLCGPGRPSVTTNILKVGYFWFVWSFINHHITSLAVQFTEMLSQNLPFQRRLPQQTFYISYTKALTANATNNWSILDPTACHSVLTKHPPSWLVEKLLLQKRATPRMSSNGPPVHRSRTNIECGHPPRMRVVKIKAWCN